MESWTLLLSNYVLCRRYDLLSNKFFKDKPINWWHNIYFQQSYLMYIYRSVHWSAVTKQLCYALENVYVGSIVTQHSLVLSIWLMMKAQGIFSAKHGCCHTVIVINKSIHSGECHFQNALLLSENHYEEYWLCHDVKFMMVISCRWSR